MNYFIKRGDQQYGPYSLAALQQYIAQGNISKDDLARSEAMTDWVPVSTIVGNVQVPSTTGFGAAVAPVDTRPLPPGLHWVVVVLVGIVTFGIFWVIWLFVQAVWLRKVVPTSRSLFYLLGYVACVFLAVPFDKTGFDAVLQLGGIVLYLIGIFGMRRDIEEYYSTLNPVGLSLSGVMTFFFNAAYFQYHLKEIRGMVETQRATASSAAAGA